MARNAAIAGYTYSRPSAMHNVRRLTIDVRRWILLFAICHQTAAERVALIPLTLDRGHIVASLFPHDVPSPS